MRVHSGEKPFVCSQCNYSCNQADRLRIYMRIHSREKIVMSKLLINCLLQMPYHFFHISNICDNIKDMWVGGRRHFGRREQPGKEDQGGQWIHGCITSSLKKIPTELIHPNVSDLPGLLLQVLLAVHSTVDQQHARTEIRQVGYLWKGLEKVCKLPDNDVFKDTKSGQKWKTLAIVCPICCNCHTLCLMAGVVKFNFQIGGDTANGPSWWVHWENVFIDIFRRVIFYCAEIFFGGGGSFSSRRTIHNVYYTFWSLRISPRQSDMADNVWQKRFWQPVECGRKKPSSFSIFYLSIYKRMSNRSVLGSLLSLSAPEDPPTFSSSNALAMMTSSGDGMTHQGHWPYHLLENCKNQLLKTKERSCLVRSIRKRQHHLRQIFSTTLSGDGVTYLSPWPHHLL